MTTEETTWHDDAFKVVKTRFGLYRSITKDDREVITAPTEESCILATRFHLKGEQEGFPEPLSAYSGTKAVDL